METPKPKRLRWKAQYRIIASQYPPIDLFEDLFDTPEEQEALWVLESLTNDRLLDETGDLQRVARDDRVNGPGASVVMAAFTHIGRPGRFNDASFGAYYAAKDLETAIRETVFHRERLARASSGLAPEEWTLRAHVGQVNKPMLDIRDAGFQVLRDPDVATYPTTQAFAKPLRRNGAWGLVYPSVRHPGGQCIAAFRPPAVSLPTSGPRLVYVWDGERVTEVYERQAPIVRFTQGDG